MRQGYRVLWILAALGLLLLPLGCALSGELRLPKREPTNINAITMTGSSLVYEFERGRVDFETTDLLDIYENGVIDLIRSPDPQVRKLIDQIPLRGEFYLLVINGERSPSSIIQINDSYFFTEDYTKRSQQFSRGHDVAFQKYSFDSGKGVQILKNLKFHLGKSSEEKTFVVSAHRLCVVQNQPGPQGEYRNGALTLQLIEANAKSFDPIALGMEKESGLLAEFSIFRESELAKCR